jgi:hypothetical protein
MRHKSFDDCTRYQAAYGALFTRRRLKFPSFHHSGPRSPSFALAAFTSCRDTPKPFASLLAFDFFTAGCRHHVCSERRYSSRVKVERRRPVTSNAHPVYVGALLLLCDCAAFPGVNSREARVFPAAHGPPLATKKLLDSTR